MCLLKLRHSFTFNRGNEHNISEKRKKADLFRHYKKKLEEKDGR